MSKTATTAFRSTFKEINKEFLTWFPGHMEKGLKQMQTKLRSVDCIIEVHDARIPISGRNADFKYKISGIKPHLLVLNKSDLISDQLFPQIKKKLHDCPNVVFTNCKDQKCKGVGSIFPLVQNLINKSDRYNRANEEDFCVMIIGIPNVGKSSLINRLRNRFLGKGNANPVGALAGITRSVMTKVKISEKPLIYMLDTPGILTPSVPNTEIGLKLALCATTQDHLVGETVIADFLLYWMNKQNLLHYVDVFRLKGPSNDIVEVLAQVALDQKKFIKTRNSNNEYIVKPDFKVAAQHVIRTFRTGGLGKIMLDQDLI